MKIVSKGKKVVSTKLIVPIDGMIEIDNEGIADVSAKCAAILVNNTNDWEFLKKQKETAIAEAPEETVEEESSEEENEDSEEQSEEKMLEELNSSSLEQLRSMCAEAEFPEKEWKNLSKKLLVKYMLKKYEEAK